MIIEGGHELNGTVVVSGAKNGNYSEKESIKVEILHK